MKKVITELEHLDKLGTKITEGCYVAYPGNNILHIGRVMKLSPKQIRVGRISRLDTKGHLLYSTNTIILDGPEILAYLLKGGQ